MPPQMKPHHQAVRLATLVREMRDKQKEYFRHRSPLTLSVCKELERRVDAELCNILDSQPSLFD
jgi:hypothetical protein